MISSNRIVFLAGSIILLSGLTGFQPVSAGAEDDAIAMYTRIYREAQRDLEFGNSYERIAAARLMGQHRNPRFIRPLQRELLKDLTVKQFRKFAVNDPYVKCEIAYALGRIGHKDSLKPLFTALEQTVAIIEDEAKDTAKHKEQANQLYQQVKGMKQEIETINQSQEPVVLRRDDRPGPARLYPSFRFPDSPDVFWSIADEFKEVPSPDDFAEVHDMRLRGYSWMNVAQSIFQAIAMVKDTDALDTMEKYGAYENRYIRYYTAVSMGDIGTQKAVGLLDKRFTSEQDPWVKVGIARGMLRADKTQAKALRFLIDNLRVDDKYIRLAATQALVDLRMGEALYQLREAHAVEDESIIREQMKRAIYWAEVDNILPVNY